MGKTRDPFRNIRDTKGTFHAKMVTVKYRNSMHLTETEEIKKRRQEYPEEIGKKDLNGPDNHNGMITHLEPDILECEVKWALGSITMNRASGGDGIPVELFKILKDTAAKVLHSVWQQIWKPQQWPQNWKGQFSFQSQRKAMAKNSQTTARLHSSHMLATYCSGFSKPGLNSYMNCEILEVEAVFRKGRGTRDQIANICWIIEKAQEFQKNIY